MSCEAPRLSISEFIRGAFQLAGYGNNRVVDGPAIKQGLLLLNMLLDLWGCINLFIPFVTEYTFDADGIEREFRIGKLSDCNVVTNPFNEITSINYTIGQITYQPMYLGWQYFQAIEFKNVCSYPEFWTWRAENGVTRLLLYPYPQSGALIALNGLQGSSEVSLFQNAMDSIAPAQAMYLQYCLASELINRGYGSPQGTFQADKQTHYLNFLRATKDDTEYEPDVPFVDIAERL
jgi:hypothetical protein